MKHKLQLIAFVAVTSILSSCGSGGDSISEVDLIPVKSGKEYQYIDQEGKIIINPQFKNAGVFRDGLALVRTSGDDSKLGFINEDGKYVINAQYLEATEFSDGLAWVVAENAAPAAIDKKGEVKFTLQDAEEVSRFKNELAAFKVVNEDGEQKYGFVNKEGKIVINPQFSYASNFSNGMCAVRNDDFKWGFIDKEGKITINYQFDYTDDFKNGKCIVTSDNKQGVIDIDGKYIINPQFTEMKIDGNMFLVRQESKWGWCDEDGKLEINPQFVNAFEFNGNSTTPVQSGKTFGYIDKEGKYTVNPQFDYAWPFNGRLALVMNAGQYGFIDKDGKYVINPQFNEVSNSYKEYIVGNDKFDEVSTDYFNIGAIISLVDFDSPEGITEDANFFTVAQKCLDLEGEDPDGSFEKYKTTHFLYEKKITNDARYKFQVKGTAFDKIKVQKGSGWYTYTDTEYRFNGKNKPTGYTYSIALSGKGYGKDKTVLQAINDKLESKGYFLSTEFPTTTYPKMHYISPDQTKLVTTVIDKWGWINIDISPYEDPE